MIDIDYFLVGKLMILINIVLYVFISNYFLKDRRVINSNMFIIILLSIISLYWGLRPFDIGKDTSNYLLSFQSAYNSVSFADYVDRYQSDYLFRGILYLCSKNSNFSIFLFVVSLLSSCGFYLLYYYLRKYDESLIFASHYTPLLILLIFSLFSYVSIYSNIIRNGAALPFALLSVFFIHKRKCTRALFFALFSYMIHSSSLLIIMLSVIAVIVDVSIFVYLFIYIISLILSINGYGIDNLGFVQFISIDKLTLYSNSKHELVYNIGFRYDFTVYNLFFIVMCGVVGNFNNKDFRYYYRLFILLSTFFVLSYNIPFSDRIGLYSWFIIPFILYYSFRSFSHERIFIFSWLMLISFFMLNFLLFF